MKHSDRKRRTVVIILLIIGTVLLVGGFAVWVLYQVSPAWFPDWFDTLFIILGGLGVLLTVLGALLSDIFLPIRDLLRGREPPPIRRLSESEPIRRVNYETLVARLGRSGKISWIDRGVTSSGLLREHGRVAVVGWMKSGKTREAAELIRMALDEGWISLVYEPMSALDLIDQDALAPAIVAKVDERQRCLFFIDELGLRPEPERLERLATCIQTILQLRPDTYFLITIQRERLISTVRTWLQEYDFHLVMVPALTVDQRRELVRAAEEVLCVTVTDEAVETLASQTDGRPYSIVFALQQASGSDTLDEAGVQELLARSDEEAWAEQRRQVISAEPVARFLLDSIVTFMSAGVSSRETSVRRYAQHQITSDSSTSSTKETRQLLDAAAERWSGFDIVATEGLYTVPEPLLLPLLVDVDQARDRLITFAETYKPGLGASLALTVMRPLNIIPRLQLLRLLRFRLVSKLGSKLGSAARHLRLEDMWLRFMTWLVESLFSWPADRALLLLELGSESGRTEYLSSLALVERGRRAVLDGDHAAALDHLGRALALNSSSAYGFGLRAETYQQMGRYEEALADFNRAIKLAPDYAWAIARRGETCGMMGRYEEALADLNRIIELDPHYDWAIAHRGETYRMMGRYKEALTDLTRAIELNPDYAWAIARRGETQVRADNYEEALRDFDRAIELDPEYEWAVVNRGATYLLMGKHPMALADLSRGLQLNPDNHLAIALRGLGYLLVGEYEAAQAVFSKAICLARRTYQKDPEDWDNTLYFALYLLAIGEAEGAESLCTEALSGGAPRHCILEMYSNLNLLLRMLPDHPQALQASAIRNELQECLQEAD